LPEQSPVELPIPFLAQRQPMTILESWQVLKRAAGDARIKAIVLEPRGLEVGWAKLQELHDDILTFRKSGKPVYCVPARRGRPRILRRPPRPIAST